jgi:hypothetical protein
MNFEAGDLCNGISRTTEYEGSKGIQSFLLELLFCAFLKLSFL